MTQQDADKLKEQIATLNVEQIGLLWRWITAEFGLKIDQAYPPKPKPRYGR
jgi:hypothetical protein